MDSLFSYSNLNINFNKNLYSLCAIEESISAFKDFFQSKIKIKEDYIMVELNFLDEERDLLIVREFCNYVLGLMQNNR